MKLKKLFFTGITGLYLLLTGTAQATQSPEGHFAAFRLQNWPIQKSNSACQKQLAEGWIYTGVIGDQKGAMHKALDFTCQKSDGSYMPFGVFAAHHGNSWQGQVESWGNFVIVRVIMGNTTGRWVDTLYAHLDPKTIPAGIPRLRPSPDGSGGAEFPEEAPAGAGPGSGMTVQPGDLLGFAGTSGDASGIPQLHFELHLRGPDLASLGLGKRDPIGFYDYAEREIGGEVTRLYPQPGESLEGLPHWFASNTPPFALGK